MTLALASLAASVAVTTSVAGTAEAAAAPTLDRHILTPRVTESSGLARSTYARDVLWTLNDEGDAPRIYAVDGAGALRATVDLAGARNVDWEDMSSGPYNTLWVGDIGDSGWKRPSVSVYKLAEPNTLSDRSVTPTRYDLAFPDGPRNAGALMVHPSSGRVYVVSGSSSGAAIYRAPSSLSTTSVNVMTKVASAPAHITSASFVPGSDRFVLGSYSTVYSYSALGATPVTAAKPSLPQSDSAEIARDGVTLYVGTEGSNSPVYRMPVPGTTTTATPTPTPTPSPTPTSSPTSAPTTATSPATSTGTSGTTLLSVGFDSLPTGQLSAANFRASLGGTNPTESEYDDSSIQLDNRGTGKVYRLKLDAGTIRGNPAGNHGITIPIALSKQVDNACLSYEVRFDGSFDWSLGGKLPGLEGVAPGVSPFLPTGGGNPGDKGWSARMMWLTPKSYSWAGPVNMGTSYLYNPKQVSYYGDQYRWGKGFTAGKWHTVQQCHVMNTVGKADGRLTAWLDGVQVLNNTGFVYRTRSDVHISHLMWSVFRGGGTLDWAGSRNSYIEFDKVKVTTS